MEVIGGSATPEHHAPRIPRGPSLRRVSSRTAMRRSCSAPVLAPVWEPDCEELEDVPSFLHSDGVRRRLTSESGAATASRSLPSTLHGPWSQVLLAVRDIVESGIRDVFSPRGGDTNAELQRELMVAAHESLQKDSRPMRLVPGLVEQRYTIKQQLGSGAHHKVMEGVHRQTQKNHALKLVPRGGRLRATKVLDKMQVFHLISSFVDEVFCHPNYVCVCFKWGTHEVDASHQLSAWIVDALHLLRELLPPSKHPYFRLGAHDMQRVLLRASCLDLYLQSNLFIQ